MGLPLVLSFVVKGGRAETATGRLPFQARWRVILLRAQKHCYLKRSTLTAPLCIRCFSYAR